MLVAVPNIIWFAAVVCAPKPRAVLEAKLADVLLPIAVLKLTSALPAVAVSPTAAEELVTLREIAVKHRNPLAAQRVVTG
jgi:hypothetical protein